MRIETSEGCTAFWTSIDGNVLHHLEGSDRDKFEELVNEAFIRITSNMGVHAKSEFITEYVKYNGTVVHEDDEPCESCGDYVTQWSLDI